MTDSTELLYVIAHAGRVSHRLTKDNYRPGIPQAAICEFLPKNPWAWAGIERPRAPCCPKCLSQSQFYGQVEKKED